MTSGITTEHGLIGFFDILGYSIFLQNNSAGEAAQIIVDVLQRLPTEVEARVRDQCNANHRPTPEELLGRLQWLIFSDTILLTLPYTSQPGTTENVWPWLIFISYAQLLHKQLFHAGLPIRGAVNCGEYFVREACFAGRIIVDAYKESQSLDLAAVVVVPDAASELDAVVDTGYPMSVRALTTDYLTPLRGGSESRRRVITVEASLLEAADLRQHVIDSFVQHKKDLPAKAHSKLTNTELFFRFCRSRKGGNAA